ncbi:hypothetical protein EVAR_31028_1 [Eumeta japonica]|uniref:Uncharacterized protein n=1 Tax=Eumeta variegata TaxID=151549 RepID=A0A4C1VEQ2_EUMVA|nr:hypothetical protein EVAR_31028_1 [Eumeta japonica]
MHQLEDKGQRKLSTLKRARDTGGIAFRSSAKYFTAAGEPAAKGKCSREESYTEEKLANTTGHWFSLFQEYFMDADRQTGKSIDVVYNYEVTNQKQQKAEMETGQRLPAFKLVYCRCPSHFPHSSQEFALRLPCLIYANFESVVLRSVAGLHGCKNSRADLSLSLLFERSPEASSLPHPIGKS